MAAECSSHTHDGKALYCLVTETGYSINVFDGVLTSTIEVNPTPIPCVPQFADAYQLSWLCIGVIATVWGVMYMRKA